MKNIFYFLLLSITPMYAMRDTKKTEWKLTEFWQQVSTKSQAEKDAIATACFLGNPDTSRWGAMSPKHVRNYQITQALYAGVNPYLGKTLNPPYPLFCIPLMEEDYTLVKLLFEFGLDPNQTGLRENPFKYVRTKKMAQLLLRHGTDIKAIKNTEHLLDNDPNLSIFYIRNNVFDINWIKNKSLASLIQRIRQKQHFFPVASALIAAGACATEDLHDDILFYKLHNWLDNRERSEWSNFIRTQIKARNAALVALKHGSMQRLVEIIKAFPAMVNATDSNGNTLLHYAIMIKDKQQAYTVVKFLMGKGAWINKHNPYGISPFALACNQRKINLACMMLPFVAPQEFNHLIQDHRNMINFVQILHKKITTK